MQLDAVKVVSMILFLKLPKTQKSWLSVYRYPENWNVEKISEHFERQTPLDLNDKYIWYKHKNT